MRQFRLWVKGPEFPHGVMVNPKEGLMTEFHGQVTFLMNQNGDIMWATRLYNSSPSKYNVLHANGTSLKDIVVMDRLPWDDSDGNPIYEGDIVTLPDTDTEYVHVGIGNVPVAQSQHYVIGTVVKENGLFGVNLPDKTYTECYSKGFNIIDGNFKYADIARAADITVIGNIYENKDIEI